jgi:hypothetical protein
MRRIREALASASTICNRPQAFRPPPLERLPLLLPDPLPLLLSGKLRDMAGFQG